MNPTSAIDLQADALPTLRHPAVRDLAWACFNPELVTLPVSMPSPRLDEPRLHWLAALDRNPKPLLECLAGQRSPRLGLYFERLWYFFLSEDPAYEVLAHNLPVREGGRTLGEFDLLYFCRERQRAVHLELAMKFYLGHGAHPGSVSPNHAWLGPNSRDRLDIKLDRMLQHQVKLGQTEAGRASLAALDIHAPLAEVHVTGRLYAPLHKTLPPPADYQPLLPLQHWCHSGERQSAITGVPGLAWYALARDQWLAPLRDPGLAQELPDPGKNLDRPLQLAGFDSDGMERRRLFIVPDAWPAERAN